MADPFEDLYDVDAAVARTNAAGEAESDKGFFDVINNAVKAEQEAALAPSWVGSLPRNLSVGAFKAALNTLETGADLAELDVPGTDVPAIPPLAPARYISDVAPDFFESANQLVNEWNEGNKLSDDIVQGVTQFAVPFGAYMRVLGGFKAGQTVANVAKAAGAETVAAGSAFAPQEGRLADLLKLGRESEGRFGELLRSISPDGSLVNSYINMMTDRENEGEWEGRFKNAIDSLAGSAAVAGLLKGAATGFKAAREIASHPPKVGADAQRGAIGDLNDIERARALRDTEVEEGGEHIVLEGDTLNTNAEVIDFPIDEEAAGRRVLEREAAERDAGLHMTPEDKAELEAFEARRAARTPLQIARDNKYLEEVFGTPPSGRSWREILAPKPKEPGVVVPFRPAPEKPKE